MNFRPTTVERAYQIAASGEYGTVTDVSEALRKEGYDARAHFVGRILPTTLRRMIKEARSKGGEAAPSERSHTR
jgi:hypothetical protein